MSPPQLPRDAPIVDVAHPVEIDLLVIFRNNADFAVLHHLDAVFSQRLDLDEPLRGKPRLNHRAAAFAFAERNRVVFGSDEQSLRFQIFDDPLARFVAVQPSVRPGVLVHADALVHHINLRQVVAQAGLEIIRIMRRGDFHRARTELGIRQLIRDDRNLALHQRQQNLFPVQVLVALVLLIHRHSRIPEHGLRTRRRHCDVLAGTDHQVANLVELARHILVLHFQV